MSNIYVQEPPTNGKVLLKTSVGDLDIELWSKEAPKACRNFVQLCMENYYNGTIFHRIVKGFIAQGGDPTGTGTGGESIYGEPFKDEIHSRLRFNRRGLVAMANAGKDDNGSQFFFTFAAANELQGKHTIFGKISGETIYNMLKLEDALVDHDDRPQYPQKIISAEILSNPFDDIVPRNKKRDEDSENQNASGEGKKKKKAGVKNYKLLSFGEEAEEDEEESVVASKAFAGKSKSTHDLLDDPKLSAMPAVDKEQSSISDQDSDSDQARQKTVENVRSKLKKSSSKSKIADPETDKAVDDEEEFEEYDFHKEKREERKRKAEEIRKEISDLKKDFKKSKQKKEEEVVRQEKKDAATDSTIEKYKNELAAYQEKKKQLPLKVFMERLIEEVRFRPVLWEISLHEYRDTGLREKAWEEISAALGKNKKEIKDDWRKLRDNHRQAVYRRKTKSGQGATNRKEWKYEQQMEFLISTMNHAETYTNIASPAGTEIEEQKQDEELIDVEQTEQNCRDKRFRETRGDKVLQYLVEKDKRKSQYKEPDELDLFFGSITQSVRSLPRHLQLRLKREILNSVSLAEEHHRWAIMNNNPSFASIPTPSPENPTDNNNVSSHFLMDENISFS